MAESNIEKIAEILAGVESRLGAKMDDIEERLGGRIGNVESVTIEAVAKISSLDVKVESLAKDTAQVKNDVSALRHGGRKAQSLASGAASLAAASALTRG